MSQTVLVVEDDHELGKLLVRAITGAGYACELVGDGVTACEKIQAAPPSAVLLDLLVPKKDGRTILRELTAGDATKEIPVIAMSGVYRGRSTARELSDSGAKAFLEKPFSTKDLIANLHAVIGPPAEQSSGESRSETKAAASISLAEQAPAQIFWNAMTSGFTGALQFSKDKARKVVLFRDGVPHSVRSNAAQECLGRRLMTSGKIDRETLQESLKRSKADRLQQGQALVAMGSLSQQDLEVALAEQAEDKLLEIFEWQTGKAWQQEGVDSMSYATPVQGWTPRSLIFRGVSRMAPDSARRALKRFNSSELTLKLDDLTSEEAASPGVQAAAAACEQASQLSDVLELHPQALFGLWVCGNVELAADEAAPTASVEAVAEESAEAVQMREFLADLTDKDHFAALGVTQESNSGDVRKAYLLLAKKYHPDRYQDRSGAERSIASSIFTRLSNAADTLQDPEKRRAYVSQLKHGGSAEADREVLQRILGAEQKFSEAESLFKRRAYADAAALFKEVLEMEPDEAEYNAYFGWSQFLAEGNRPDAAKLAKQYLNKALSLAPKSTTTLYFLGLYHKTAGEDDLAQRMFNKVLELQPRHAEAEREVRLMQRRQNKSGGASGSGGGLFGLGRKK